MLLDQINSPDDLQKLPPEQLPALCAEIRGLIVRTVGANGGHLSSSLGAVELITALHCVFHSPDDAFLFDVGHQAYAHKILTGRREFFTTLRRTGGCAGFPCCTESKHDVGYSGHAGAAISTAVGLAAARTQQHQSGHVIAVVGDGSLSSGTSLEGLNNAAMSGCGKLIVILNDNKMSIGRNVGAISGYLNEVISGNFYNRSKTIAKTLMRILPRHESIHRGIQKLEAALKSMILPGVLFEELGFRYIGPINGHDLPELLKTLKRLKALDGPLLLHVITEKGRGYEIAEKNPSAYHGVSGFDCETGKLPEKKPSFSSAFGRTLCEMAAEHSDICAVSAAMIGGTGLSEFAQKFPGRIYDTGIAESHAVTFAGGLAEGGIRVFCSIYASFFQRALDNLYHDVCLPRRRVIFMLDRAGVVEDGPTHCGIYDLGFLRSMPNLTILQPRCEAELSAMMHFVYEKLDGPAVIRYPRGGASGNELLPLAPIQNGRAEILQKGDGKIVIWALGAQCDAALQCAELLEKANLSRPDVVNCRFVAPFDRELARTLCRGKWVISIEDHVVSGGLASALDEALFTPDVLPVAGRAAFGWPVEVMPHGKPEDLQNQYGLTAQQIAGKIQKLITGENR